MQYTESLTDCLKGIAQDYRELIDWQSPCEQVNDPRSKQGKRFSITSILLLALAAILSNHLSQLAIAQWGAGLSQEKKKALGFEKGVTPHQSTIQRLFRKLKVDEVEAAFRQIMVQRKNSEQEKRGEVALSIDGKAQRGRLKFEEKKGYPVHAVSLLAHQTGIVWSQGHVEKTDLDLQTDPASVKKPGEEKEQETEEEKQQQSGLAVAARLILHVDWAGKVLTGDALYCQRCLCASLRLAGGDYLFLVKGNQPTLLEEIQLLFAPVPAAKRAGQGVLLLPEQTAQTSEKGHGRLNIRSLGV